MIISIKRRPKSGWPGSVTLTSVRSSSGGLLTGVLRCSVEALRDVALDVPFCPGPRLLYGFQGRMTAAARSEAVGVITKLRLVVRLQEGAYHFLQQLVGPRG